MCSVSLFVPHKPPPFTSSDCNSLRFADDSLKAAESRPHSSNHSPPVLTWSVRLRRARVLVKLAQSSLPNKVVISFGPISFATVLSLHCGALDAQHLIGTRVE